MRHQRFPGAGRWAYGQSSWIQNQDLNSYRYPEYNRLDLRIDRRIIATNFNMVFFLYLMNIYNRHNLWEYQYNDDGTREEILQFEVFPVGGLSIEF